MKKSALLVLLTMSATKKTGPTWVAKKGNVEVPIYTIKPGCLNQQYVVCHYEAGKRKRRTFSALEKAKAEATIVAEILFRFAAQRRYLRKAHPGVADVEKASAIVGEPEIFPQPRRVG